MHLESKGYEEELTSHSHHSNPVSLVNLWSWLWGRRADGKGQTHSDRFPPQTLIRSNKHSQSAERPSWVIPSSSANCSTNYSRICGFVLFVVVQFLKGHHHDRWTGSQSVVKQPEKDTPKQPSHSTKFCIIQLATQPSPAPCRLSTKRSRSKTWSTTQRTTHTRIR